MVRLIGSPVEIIACPIVREADGLALSSRNVRLTPEGRAAAPAIYRILSESRSWARELTPAELIERVTREINAVPTYVSSTSRSSIPTAYSPSHPGAIALPLMAASPSTAERCA